MPDSVTSVVNQDQRLHITPPQARFQRITVKEYLDKNLLSFYPKASERTQQCYITAAKNINDLIGSRFIDELSRSILQTALNKLVNKSQSAIDKIRLVMKKMIEMAVEDDLITKNVADKVVSPKSHQTDNRTEEEKVYNSTQLAEILTMAKEEKDPQLFSIMTVLAFTGIRPGEVRGLEKTDVHFNGNEINIRQAATTRPILEFNHAISAPSKPRKHTIGPTKSRTGVRTLYLCDECLTVLQKWLDYLRRERPAQFKSKFLFPNESGGILRDDVLDTKFRRFKKRHGIDKNFRLYQFRHTFCTNLFHEKVDIKTIQKLMGDATVDVILQVYAHVRSDDTLQASEGINQAYVKMLPDLFDSKEKKT